MTNVKEIIINDDKVIISGARMIHRNFSGRETDYNKPGNRNFCVIIDDPKAANILYENGWNVRVKPPRDEDGEPTYYLPIAVCFDRRPPSVHLITSTSNTTLDEKTVETLDYADITWVDMTIRPAAWQRKDKAGIKAYLKTLYVTIEEDEFADKYARDNEPDEEE